MVKESGTYLIAEVGLEHCGSGAKASQLTIQAKIAGADCVKRQWFYPDEVGPVIWDKVKQFVLNKESLYSHKEFCKNEGIDSLYSAFGMQSLLDLKEAGYDAVKIPSVCNENTEMVKWAIENFEKVYISTGMLEQDKLPSLIRKLKTVLLMCTSAYPCPYDQVQLSGLVWYDGISDHTLGWEIPVAATALGARVIEKHLTLDKMNGGPDSKIALDPREFADMTRRIRNVELAMGDGKKKIEDSERGLLWRKKI